MSAAANKGISPAGPGARSRVAGGKWARLTAVAIVLCAGYASAGDASPALIKIAVFDFELEDMSAAGGTGAGPDETKFLAQVTEEAKQKLAQSGHYAIVDTAKADLAAAEGHGLRNCRGCDTAFAAKLGADQAMVGVVTKISMTEYTVTVQVSDARTGAVIRPTQRACAWAPTTPGRAVLRGS